MATGQAQAALQAAGNALNSSYAKKTEGPSNLAKDDFLKLMMAQATNQDPMNPMDSQGMMNQLTSMGSLEQLMNLNKQLGDIKQVQTDISRSNVFSFLDKDVKVKGGSVRVNEGQAPGMSYSIPRDADLVKVNIADSSGNPVRSLTLGAQGPGSHSVSWDTTTEDGEPVPNGLYHYQVVAKTEDDEQVPVQLMMQGKVSGVRFENGRPMLKVNGEEVDMNEIIEMSNRSGFLFGGKDPLPLRTTLDPRPPVINRR